MFFINRNRARVSLIQIISHPYSPLLGESGSNQGPGQLPDLVPYNLKAGIAGHWLQLNESAIFQEATPFQRIEDNDTKFSVRRYTLYCHAARGLQRL